MRIVGIYWMCGPFLFSWCVCILVSDILIGWDSGILKHLVYHFGDLGVWKFFCLWRLLGCWHDVVLSVVNG